MPIWYYDHSIRKRVQMLLFFYRIHKHFDFFSYSFIGHFFLILKHKIIMDSFTFNISYHEQINKRR